MKAPDPSDRPTATTAARRHGPEAALRWQAQTFLANRDAIIVTDLHGRVLDWNPAAERIFGYTREEMLGQPTATIHRPEDVPALSQTIRDGLTREGAWAGEIVYRRKDGSTGICETTVSPLLDEHGQVVGAFGVNRDITDRRHLERAEAERARELRTIFAAVADGVAIYDQTGRLVQWNEALAALFEFERQPEYATLPLDERPARINVRGTHGQAIPPGDLPFMRATRGEILTGARAVDLLVSLPSGREAEVSASAAPLRDDAGQVVGAVTVYRDVTERRRAEEALRESEERFRSLADDVPMFIWMADAQGDVTYANRALLDFIGVSDYHAFTGKVWEGIIHPDDIPRAYAIYEQALREREPFSYELRYREPVSGAVQWHLVKGIPRYVAGELRGTVGVAVNIHDRKLAEEALRESEEKYRATFTHAHTGLALTDLQGRFVQVNAAYCALTGYSEAELYATDLASITHPEDRARNLEQLEQLVAGTIPGFVIEKRYLRKDGRIVWVRNSVFLVLDREGNPRNIGAVIEDITEGKRVGDALRESEEKFRTLAENIPALAWMAQPDGYIFWYNQRWYDYTGATPESQLGAGWQSVHDPDVLPEVWERWRHSLESGQPFEMVFPLRGADGVFHPFLTRVAPVTDARGRVVRWFGTNTDVTDQRQIEEALRAANDALAAANQTKDEFLGVASHELRTPLTSISMNVQLANKQLRGLSHTAAVASDAALRQRVERTEFLLERSERQLARMNRLVGDLIDVSRIQAGKLDLRPEACDLLAIVREAVEEQRAAWPERTISLDLPRRAAALPIDADADRIGQAVTNYLTNALKYSAVDRPVTVRVRVVDGSVRVEVRDHGPGLTPEQRAHLFERFYRVPGIEQQSGSGVGLGLGLHICQTMIERHGGQVGVESTPGKGSTFWFTLPLATPLATSTGAEADERA